MKYYCIKCGKHTEHIEKQITTKAGDKGYNKTTGYICSICNFSPLFIKEDYKENKIKDNITELLLNYIENK